MENSSAFTTREAGSLTCIERTSQFCSGPYIILDASNTALVFLRNPTHIFRNQLLSPFAHQHSFLTLNSHPQFVHACMGIEAVNRIVIRVTSSTPESAWGTSITLQHVITSDIAPAARKARRHTQHMLRAQWNECFSSSRRTCTLQAINRQIRQDSSDPRSRDASYLRRERRQSSRARGQ